MLRTPLLIGISFILGACATPRTNPSQESPSVPPVAEVAAASTATSENCTVHVYRNKTSFHALNPEQPFLYVGEQRIARLAIGSSHCLRLAPGKHTISVKEPIMFMPAYTTGRIEVDVTGAAPIYVRYSKEFSGIVSAGSTVTATGRSNLQVASEDHWRTRQ